MANRAEGEHVKPLLSIALEAVELRKANPLAVVSIQAYATLAAAYVEAVEALEKISAKKYENRVTVSEATAWRHFQILNKEVCEIFDIARAVLKETAHMAVKAP